MGLGAYNMDSHNCRRLAQDGAARNEGDVQVGVKPYPVSYRAIIPPAGECENLWVPVALSATHIAYGSIRMKPVFMILGQSAATAASLAIDDRVPAQKVDYAKLRAQLLQDGQVLAWTDTPAATAPAPKHDGLILDDADAQKTGEWIASNASPPQAGTGYLHDGNTHKGELSVRWSPDIADAGDYEIELLFPPNANRATNAPVLIELPGQPAHRGLQFGDLRRDRFREIVGHEAEPKSADAELRCGAQDFLRARVHGHDVAGQNLQRQPALFQRLDEPRQFDLHIFRQDLPARPHRTFEPAPADLGDHVGGVVEVQFLKRLVEDDEREAPNRRRFVRTDARGKGERGTGERCLREELTAGQGGGGIRHAAFFPDNRRRGDARICDTKMLCAFTIPR